MAKQFKKQADIQGQEIRKSAVSKPSPQQGKAASTDTPAKQPVKPLVSPLPTSSKSPTPMIVPVARKFVAPPMPLPPKISPPAKQVPEINFPPLAPPADIPEPTVPVGTDELLDFGLPDDAASDMPLTELRDEKKICDVPDSPIPSQPAAETTLLNGLLARHGMDQVAKKELRPGPYTFVVLSSKPYVNKTTDRKSWLMTFKVLGVVDPRPGADNSSIGKHITVWWSLDLDFVRDRLERILEKFVEAGIDMSCTFPPPGKEVRLRGVYDVRTGNDGRKYDDLVSVEWVSVRDTPQEALRKRSAEYSASNEKEKAQ